MADYRKPDETCIHVEVCYNAAVTGCPMECEDYLNKVRVSIDGIPNKSSIERKQQAYAYFVKCIADAQAVLDEKISRFKIK